MKAETVWVVEGEKDVHTLEGAGVVATTNSGGAREVADGVDRGAHGEAGDRHPG